MVEAPDSPPHDSDMSPTDNQSAYANTLFPSNSNSNSNVRGSGVRKIDHGAPGSAWSSKKFQEEYNRAFNNLLDRDTDILCKSTNILGRVKNGLG